MRDWQTHPVPARRSDIPWKEFVGEACPHGLELVLVDGTHVRNTYDSDFVQGGNGFRYRFVPRGELWVEVLIPAEERPLVAFHECYETELMRGGMDYEHAHTRAKLREDRFRHQSSPPAANLRARARQLEQSAMEHEDRGELQEASGAFGRAAMLREQLGQQGRASLLRVLAIEANRPGRSESSSSSTQHPMWRSP